MNTDAIQTPIHFRGEPARVEGFLQVRHSRAMTSARLAARIRAPKIFTLDWPYVQSIPAAEGVTRFVLRLPEATPPGTYTGVLEVDDEKYPFEALVDARTWFTILPNKLSLVAEPEHEEIVELIGVNRGNTLFQVPDVADVNLFDSGSLLAAVNAALSSKVKGGQERVSRFVDSLARNSEMLSLGVLAGAGAIAPGESRRLTVRLRLPENLQAGHTYRGGWELPHMKFVIQVYVPAAAPAAEV